MNVFWISVVAFFALYGFMHMLLVALLSLRRHNADKAKETYMVVTVKNQQDTVEGIIRSIVWKSLRSAGSREVPIIVIVDLGSEDETPEILKRLELEYEFIHVMSKEKYVEMVQGMG